MKRCKYCKTINSDNATNCSSCGASEFVYQCENCGSEFEGGKFCPTCGTKVGQVAKVCPNCGSEYYSNACPSCGYVKAQDSGRTVHQTIIVEKTPEKKKKVTFGTVLLWIFFLPIMATIAIWKSSWTTKKKIIVTAAIWLVFLIIGATNKDEDNTTTEVPTATAQTEKSDIVADTSIPADDSSSAEKVIYEKDEVVNQFLVNYNQISSSPFEDIEQGNIKQKAHGHSYGYWCTLLDAADTDKIFVTINESDDNAEAGVTGMRDVFHDVVLAIDSTLEDEEIYTFFDKMVLDGIDLQEEPLGKAFVSFGRDIINSDGSTFRRGFIKVGEK